MNFFSVLDESDNEEDRKVVPAKKGTAAPAPAAKKDAAPAPAKKDAAPAKKDAPKTAKAVEDKPKKGEDAQVFTTVINFVNSFLAPNYAER